MIADPYWLVLDHDELPDEDAKFWWEREKRERCLC